MTHDDVWLPPTSGTPQSGMPQPDRAGLGPWIAAALGLSFVMVLGAVLAGALGLELPRDARSLPTTYEEMQRQQGTKVLIDSGVTADGRSYRFEVSRHSAGYLCSFLHVTTADAGGAGGGGCGPADPVSFSTGDNGAVHGLAATRVASVRLTTPTGTVSLLTKALPSPFSERRYFLTVLPVGTLPSRLVAFDGNGDVVKDQELAPPHRPRRRP